MTYELQVYGHTWEGRLGTYVYNPDTGTALTLAKRPEPFATADVKRVAGDFQSIIDWRLVERTEKYRHGRGGGASYDITVKCLRGFRAGMTLARFTRLNYGRA